MNEETVQPETEEEDEVTEDTEDNFSMANFATVPELEEKGVWIKYHQSLELKVRRMGNERMTKAVRRIQKMKASGGWRDQGGGLNDLTEEEAIHLLCSHVLIDWRGMYDKDADGKITVVVPFSIDQAKAYMHLSKDFKTDVLQMATEREQFLRHAEDDDEKNSEAS